DAESGKELASVPEMQPFTAPDVSADGRRLLTYRTFTGTTARLWDLETAKELLAVRVPGGQLRSAALSPDRSRIVTAAEGGLVRVWDAAPGKELPGFRPPQGAFGFAAFSPDGRQLLTTDGDTARRWDAATGQELATVFAREGSPRSVIFAPDGRRVLALLLLDTPTIWGAGGGTGAGPGEGARGRVWGAAVGPDR